MLLSTTSKKYIFMAVNIKNTKTQSYALSSEQILAVNRIAKEEDKTASAVVRSAINLLITANGIH